MREQVRAWLAELGYTPEDRTDAAHGEGWAWRVVLLPDPLDVFVIGSAGSSEILIEARAALGLESLGSRRGPDVAHRVRAAIQHRRTPPVETEIHKNGRLWLRVHMGSEEFDKGLLAQRLEALRKEHDLFRRWVADALSTGTLPP